MGALAYNTGSRMAQAGNTGTFDRMDGTGNVLAGDSSPAVILDIKFFPSRGIFKRFLIFLLYFPKNYLTMNLFPFPRGSFKKI